MTYRSGNVERAAGVPPIPAEVVALQRLSALCQNLPSPTDLQSAAHRSRARMSRLKLRCLSSASERFDSSSYAAAAE